jgi:hypothetical protein
MILFMAMLAAGVLVGYLTGGRLRGVANLRLRAGWLVWLAVVLVLLAHLPWGGGSVARESSMTVQVSATVGGFLIVNAFLQRSGIRVALVLMAVGWLLNFAVVAANGAMPVPADLLDRSASSTRLAGLAVAHLDPHVPISSSTELPWLGDALRVQVPGWIVPLSVGDVLLFVGTIVLVVLAMRTSSRRSNRSHSRDGDAERFRTGKSAGGV